MHRFKADINLALLIILLCILFLAVSLVLADTGDPYSSKNDPSGSGSKVDHTTISCTKAAGASSYSCTQYNFNLYNELVSSNKYEMDYCEATTTTTCYEDNKYSPYVAPLSQPEEVILREPDPIPPSPAPPQELGQSPGSLGGLTPEQIKILAQGSAKPKGTFP